MPSYVIHVIELRSFCLFFFFNALRALIYPTREEICQLAYLSWHRTGREHVKQETLTTGQEMSDQRAGSL